MNYMNHYTKIDDLITLLGDFPLPVGDVTREGDTIDGIINNLGVDANTFNRENERIFDR